MRRASLVLFVAVLTVLAASCGLFGRGYVALEATGNPQEAFPARFPSVRSVTKAAGGATIVVTEVEMVLFEVNLTVPDSTDAEDLEVGPILLDLPLGAVTDLLVESLGVADETYEALKIEVKIPEGHEDQAVFEALYPAWDIAKSVRVVGTYNDLPFTLLLDVDGDFQLNFDPALTITGGGQTGVVLAIDVSTWFLTADGNGLIDPRSVDLAGSDAAQIRANIADSFEAFEDN